MPPDPPRRGQLPTIREENVSRAPHTPIPNDAPTGRPPAMPMPPPRGYEGPRARPGRPDLATTKVGLGPPLERRPEPANPPPPESTPPTAAPRAKMPSVEVAEVQANFGKGRSFSGPAWAFIVLTLVGGAVAITYFVTRNSDSARPPSDAVLTELRAFREEQHAVNADVKLQLGLLTGRVGATETTGSELRATVAGIAAANPRFSPPVNVAVSQALTQSAQPTRK